MSAVRAAGGAGRQPLPVVTPEGVPLHFQVARAGDRLGAFLLDWLLTIVVSIVLFALAIGATGGDRGNVLWAFVLLALFLLQSFYFVWFEIRGRGMTPAKRRVGIRVMDAGGGTLTGRAVVVRNVMRTLEVQIPLAAVIAPEALWPGAPGWARLLASAWLFVLAGMPLFNRRRLRVGDMVAGTVVVVAPQARLLRDIGGAQAAVEEEEETPRFRFTKKQLAVYGAYELQVLEDVLRGRETAASEAQVFEAVSDRIARKIRWKEPLPPREAKAFLLAYYTALRGRLEQRMLLGKRKKDKHSR